MFKRATALFFIMLANIILLAHSVVLHHHHADSVYIVHSNYSLDNDFNKHSATKHNHENEGKNDYEYCILKQVVVIQSNLLKQECKWLDSTSGYNDFYAYQANWRDIQSDLLSFLDVSVIPLPPLIQASYSYLINNSKGLRAPPLV